MYHIPKDKRAYISAEGLYEGLLSSLRKKSLQDINVTDIISNCRVSRATFYRLFDNPSDILQYKSDAFLKEAIDQARGLNKASLSECFLTYIAALMGNKELLQALIANNRTDILSSSHEKYMEDIERIFLATEGLSKEDNHLLSSMLVGIIPSVFKLWLSNQSKTSEEVLMEVRKGVDLMGDLFAK